MAAEQRQCQREGKGESKKFAVPMAAVPMASAVATAAVVPLLATPVVLTQVALARSTARSTSATTKSTASGAAEIIFFWSGTKKNEVDRICPDKHVFSQWNKSKFRGNLWDAMHNQLKIPALTYHKLYDTTHTCKCAEQWMMCAKALMFNDLVSFKKILATTSPMAQKALGRQVKGFHGPTWMLHAQRIVEKGNYLKFTQNATLQKVILDTKDHVLAEASPKDGVWGIELNEAKAKTTPRSKWPGKNLLGLALMNVRSQIRALQTCASLTHLLKRKAVAAAADNAEGDGDGNDDGEEPRAKRSKKMQPNDDNQMTT